MSCVHARKVRAILVIALFLVPLILFGQAAQPLTWQQNLNALRNASTGNLAESQVTASAIRSQVEIWLALHPDSNLVLPPAPAQPWSPAETRAQILMLSDAVGQILKEDPDQPFTLGLQVVNVTAAASTLSPVADSIDQTEISSRHAQTVTQALQYLPGVTVDHKSSRNQTGISIRGFDTRQVPLYLDGIPIYVPYDGYADLGRFLTNDIAEIQVARGYSSPLSGPNGLGGAVNLVTKAPEKKLEGEAAIGTGSGNMLDSTLRLGSRWTHFFFQGSLNWLQTDYFPLSGDFPLTTIQPAYHRLNSDQRDERFSGRVGWTPRGTDKYVFSYANQKGTYGDPPYSGSSPCPASGSVNYPCSNAKFWKWPYWNKTNYYFNSQTALGESSSIRFRAFYDQYRNGLEMYDDATYSSMNKNSSSGISNYDDHSDGFSSEFETHAVARNSIGGSFFLKSDTHREDGISFNAKNVQSVSPWQSDRDRQISIGVLDSINISSKLHATAGFSADHLKGLQAQDLNSAKTGLIPYQVPGLCSPATATSFDACADRLWIVNPLASVSWNVTSSASLFVTFAEKSHFPTLKDRYSYKFNKALPNPTLDAERARNWTVGYSRAFNARTIVDFDLFRSDVHDAIEILTFASTLCSAGKGYCTQSVNVGKEVHQGAELLVRSTPLTRLTLDANYTFLNRSISDAPNVFPTGTPKHKAVGTATVRAPRRVLIVSSLRYEGGTITTTDNGFVIPASKFAAMDLGAIVPIRAFTLQVGVKNLFDRNYYYQEGFPEAGRNWYASMRYRF